MLALSAFFWFACSLRSARPLGVTRAVAGGSSIHELARRSKFTGACRLAKLAGEYLSVAGAGVLKAVGRWSAL